MPGRVDVLYVVLQSTLKITDAPMMMGAPVAAAPVEVSVVALYLGAISKQCKINVRFKGRGGQVAKSMETHNDIGSNLPTDRHARVVDRWVSTLCKHDVQFLPMIFFNYSAIMCSFYQ